MAAFKVVYGNIIRLRLFWGRDLIVREYLPSLDVELRSRSRVGIDYFHFSYNLIMLPNYGRISCQNYCLQTTSSSLFFILAAVGILYVR